MIYLVASLIFLGLILALVVLLMVFHAIFTGNAEVAININKDKKIPAEGGSSLLQALSENEIFIPSACGGKGSCGFCKIQVDSHPDALPQELAYLSRDERREGVRLACQCKVNGKMDLTVPDTLLNAQKYRAEVVKAEPVTYDIVELRFKILDGATVDLTGGFYIQLIVPEYHEEFRAYSISNDPAEKDHVDVMIRLVPNGLCSTYAHALEVGDVVEFTGPYGEFEMDESEDTELILVGGGVGLPPLKSLVHDVLGRFKSKKVALYFGCRAVKDIFYLDYFQEIEKKHENFEVHYALSDLDPGDKWDGDTGFVHLSLDKRMRKSGPRQAFLCGPAPMINAVTAVLKKNGLKDEEIFWDDFGV
jgi:Na+-transporting NADH:ubiquinone oxidoreductase subunit F